MPQFTRYIGIDYSGAKTPESSCKGLFMRGSGTPEQVQPPPVHAGIGRRRESTEMAPCGTRPRHPHTGWHRRAFSFPLAYFERYRLSSDWEDFLVEFQHHWPTEDPATLSTSSVAAASACYYLT